uniref:Uncharacterized protein n=1 Tax=Plectus sambesii TaxID=2011161 RepID=A0A914WLT3_9BILA
MVRTYATNPLYLRADAALPPKTPRTPQQKLLSRLRDDYHHRLAAVAPNATTLRRHHSAPVVRVADQPLTALDNDTMTTVGLTPAELYYRSVDKEQKAEHRAALQAQIKEQQAKRINEDSAYYGGVNLKALKLDNQSQSASQHQPKTMQKEDPPWLRGNPQPRNGIRGTQQWKDGQQISKSPSMPTGLNYGAPSPISQPIMYQRIATPVQHVQAPSPARQRLMERQKAAEEFYDPFGKGGAGAPIRDRDGNVVTDRRKMRQSWSKTIDSNIPHDYEEGKLMRSHSFSTSYGSGQMPYMSTANSNPLSNYNTMTPSQDYGFDRSFGDINELRAIDPFAALSGTNGGGGYVPRAPSSRAYAQPSPAISPAQLNLNASLAGRQMTDKERHKMELAQQIAENKRLREMEKQKELAEEAEHQRKIDAYNAKQQAEIEAEKRKLKEKAIEQERRAQEAAEKARQKHVAPKQQEMTERIICSDDDYIMPEEHHDEPPSLMHRSTSRRPSNKSNYDGLFEDDRKGGRSRTSDRHDNERQLIELIRSSRAVLDSAKSRRSTRPPQRTKERDHMGGFLSDEDDEHPDKIVDNFLRKRK